MSTTALVNHLQTVELDRGDKSVVAFFDLDRTLIAGYSIVAIARERIRHGLTRGDLKESAVILKELVRQQRSMDSGVKGPGYHRLVKTLTRSLQGVREETLTCLGEQAYHHSIARSLYSEAVALVVAGYAVSYAVSVLLRAHWTRRMRRANLVMAGVVAGVSALWLTPVLNAERMSVASQLNRAEDGVKVADLPIWEMTHDWGRAGARGITRLLEMEDHAQHAEITALVEKARATDNKYRFQEDAKATDFASLEGRVPVFPEGASLPPGAFDAMASRDRNLINSACERILETGGPGCAIVVVDFDPRITQLQAMGFFLQDSGWVRVMALEVQNGALVQRGSVRGFLGQVRAQQIIDIQAGAFDIVPLPLSAIKLGDLEFYTDN